MNSYPADDGGRKPSAIPQTTAAANQTVIPWTKTASKLTITHRTWGDVWLSGLNMCAWCSPAEATAAARRREAENHVAMVLGDTSIVAVFKGVSYYAIFPDGKN
jgi:hypothetical protein